MMNYSEALQEMYKGNVVRLVGTANGNAMVNNGARFCMCRGCIFLFNDGTINWNTMGRMVYDPDFLYEATGETVDQQGWKPKDEYDRTEIKLKLGRTETGV